MSYPHMSSDCDQYHGLVKDFGGPRPTIAVLCGSTRFRDAFDALNRELTLAGLIVVAPGVFGHTDPIWAAMPDDKRTTIKATLDDLHLRKIELADVVWVANPGGYIGESTRNEIAYAEQLGKPIHYLVDAPAPVPA